MKVLYITNPIHFHGKIHFTSRKLCSMGMFDTIFCDYPLPDAEVQHEDFQTKDLGENLDTYRITAKGQLLYETPAYEDEGPPPTGVRRFHGVVRFYTSIHRQYDPPILVFAEDSDVNDTEQAEGSIVEMEWYEYEATFTKGNLTEIVRTSQRESSFRLEYNTISKHNLNSRILTREAIQSALEGNRRIVLPNIKFPEQKRLRHIADIPAPTLEVIKTLNYDKFLEKHEGPWEWESAFRYGNACLIHLRGEFGERPNYTVLMPFAERHAANIEVVNVAESNNMLTVFFVCPSLAGMERQADNRRWSSFCAVCREVHLPGDEFYDTLPFYITLMLHKIYLSEPEMGDYWVFQKLFD